MRFENIIAFLIALLLMFGWAQSLVQPSDSLDRGVEGSAPKPLCRRTLRGGTSLVNKDQTLSPADAVNNDGSGMTESPTKSPKEMSASSTHSLHTNSFCPDCQSGSIDPSTLIPTPP
ncbi:hypothetical protein COCNU_03G001190 [Cocos nucifera]|uniref:Uncharacterized protein n=1 Tax=Cocos nucifera TaxID=13894 RepID=A0A8K0MY29_COCNU|nr:hypothetical protein COCNU_03G001190 [Cocos nucifera]